MAGETISYKNPDCFAAQQVNITSLIVRRAMTKKRWRN